jgi:transcriptional regulator with XRE-family HTH domain
MRDMRHVRNHVDMPTEEGPSIPTIDDLGARLALIRWHMGWNQKQAAEACGVPAATWRDWETYRRAPRQLVQVAARISQVTGVDEYWILTGRRSREIADHFPRRAA